MNDVLVNDKIFTGFSDMATSVENGVDVRKIVKRYEGERNSALVIRDQVLYCDPFPGENMDLKPAYFDVV